MSLVRHPTPTRWLGRETRRGTSLVRQEKDCWNETLSCLNVVSIEDAA